MCAGLEYVIGRIRKKSCKSTGIDGITLKMINNGGEGVVDGFGSFVTKSWWSV